MRALFLALGLTFLLPITACDSNEPETCEVGELETEDLRDGTGAEARASNTVIVRYTGRLLDGTEFDNGQLTFNVTRGNLIPGFKAGVIGMKLGGERRVTIPPNLAYGPNSPNDNIPACATLVFDIELLDIVG